MRLWMLRPGGRHVSWCAPCWLHMTAGQEGPCRRLALIATNAQRQNDVMRRSISPYLSFTSILPEGSEWAPARQMGHH